MPALLLALSRSSILRIPPHFPVVAWFRYFCKAATWKTIFVAVQQCTPITKKSTATVSSKITYTETGVFLSTCQWSRYLKCIDELYICCNKILKTTINWRGNKCSRQNPRIYSQNILTWSLVFTTHNGFVAMAVAAPAPAAATTFAPTVSWLFPSPAIQYQIKKWNKKRSKYIEANQ